MSDIVYRGKDLQELKGKLECYRAEQRFDDRMALSGTVIGATGLAIGCATNYFGGQSRYEKIQDFRDML